MGTPNVDRQVAPRGGSTAASVVVLVCLCAWLAPKVLYIGTHPTITQWDFDTYYYAAKAQSAGLNPYDPETLARVAGRAVSQRYLYPLPALFVFRPFGLLPFAHAALAYLIAKLLLLGALLWLWCRHFVAPAWRVWFLCYAAVALKCTILADIRSGNVAIAEQALLWSAFSFYVAGRLGMFRALAIVAAAPKVLPLGFLALVRREPEADQARGIAVAVAAAALFYLAGYLMQPAWFGDMLSNLARCDERGALNPCSLALIRDIADSAAKAMHLQAKVGIPLAWLMYLPYVTVVLALSWRRMQLVVDARTRVLFACATYALVAPRFKEYSYILVVLPAFHAATPSGARTWARMAVLLLSLMVLPAALASAVSGPLAVTYGYTPLFAAAFTWWCMYSNGAAMVTDVRTVGRQLRHRSETTHRPGLCASRPG